MIFKAIKSWLLFEKELRSLDKGMKKAGVKNQAKYYTPVFDKEGFHHWMKKGERAVTEEEIAYKVNIAKAECRNKGLDMLGYKVCLYFTKQTILDLLIVRNQIYPELTFNECKNGGIFMGCTFKIADEDKIVIEKKID